MLERPPVEVTVKLHGWTPGESQICLSIPQASDMGRALDGASPAEQDLLYGRLLRHTIAELIDAFGELVSPSEPFASVVPRRPSP